MQCNAYRRRAGFLPFFDRFSGQTTDVVKAKPSRNRGEYVAACVSGVNFPEFAICDDAFWAYRRGLSVQPELSNPSTNGSEVRTSSSTTSWNYWRKKSDNYECLPNSSRISYPHVWDFESVG